VGDKKASSTGYNKKKVVNNLDGIDTIAKKAGFSGFGEVAALCINFFTVVLITRIAGAKIYGIFLIAEGVITILIVLSLCGMKNGIVRYVSFYKAKDDPSRIKGIILSALLTGICLSVLVSVVTFLFSKIIAVNIFHEIEVSLAIKILVISVPFLVIKEIFLSTIHGFQAIKELVFVNQLMKPSAKFLFTAVFFLLGLKLMGVLFAYIITSIILVVSAGIILSRMFPFIDHNLRPLYSTKEFLNFSWPLFLTQFLSIIIHWTDIMMLGYFLSSKEVGIYGVVLKVGPFIVMPLLAFNLVFSPLISELHTKGELDRLGAHFKLITKWILLFSFPIFIFLILFPGHILSLFGGEFSPARIPLFLICLGELINSITGPSGYMIMMTGRPKLSLLNSTLMGGLNIILNYLLIPRYGMQGAAFATCFSMSFINIIRVVEIYYLLRLHPYSMKMLKPFGSGLISLVIFYLLRPQFSGLLRVNRFAIIIPGMLFFGFYALILFLLRFDIEDRFIMKKIAEKIGTKAGIKSKKRFEGEK